MLLLIGSSVVQLILCSLRLCHIIDSSWGFRKILNITHVPIIVLHFIDAYPVESRFKLCGSSCFCVLLFFVVLRFVSEIVREVAALVKNISFTVFEWLIVYVVDFTIFIFAANSWFIILNDSTSFGVSIRPDRDWGIATLRSLSIIRHRSNLAKSTLSGYPAFEINGR